MNYFLLNVSYESQEVHKMQHLKANIGKKKKKYRSNFDQSSLI